MYEPRNLHVGVQCPRGTLSYVQSYVSLLLPDPSCSGGLWNLCSAVSAECAGWDLGT